MMIAEFDARGFADRVSELIDKQGYGAKQRALKATGIPNATFHRLLSGEPPRSIDVILSAAAYFEIKLAEFVKVRERS